FPNLPRSNLPSRAGGPAAGASSSLLTPPPILLNWPSPCTEHLMATVDLDHQSLKRSLFQMTWPMLFGVLSLMSFQLVDSAFISQLGVDPLAALGFTVPMYQLVIGLQVGLGIATTAVIARTLGEGNPERAARLGGLVVTLGAVLVALLCLGLWLFRDAIMSALGAAPRLLPLISSFWAPWLLAAWLGAMVYFGYSLS